MEEINEKKKENVIEDSKTTANDADEKKTKNEKQKPVKGKKKAKKKQEAAPQGYYAEVFVMAPDPEEPVEEALDKEGMKRRRGEFRQYLTEEVDCLFQDFDIRGNGFLTLEDIRLAYKDFEIGVNTDDCQAIVKAFDVKGYGHIRLNDFHREMYDIMCDGTNEEHLKMVFKAMDLDNDGVIGANELTQQFQKLGALVIPEEAKEATVRIDKISQGYIDFKQFKIFCYEIDKINTFEKNSMGKGK